MRIKLEGGYELDDGWEKVQHVGDRMLRACGFVEWEVTLRPTWQPGVEEAERRPNCEPQDCDLAIDAPARQLTVVGLRLDGGLPIAELIELHVLDTINEIIEVEKTTNPQVQPGTAF